MFSVPDSKLIGGDVGGFFEQTVQNTLKLYSLLFIHFVVLEKLF